MEVIDKLWITDHTKGLKLEGFRSLNVSVVDNEFCTANTSIESTVCTRCYARSMERRYTTFADRIAHNTKMLAREFVPRAVIDRMGITDRFFRFHSVGELYGYVHYNNLCRIAESYPETRFALWTKRPRVVQGPAKPDNLILILSSPFLGAPAPLEPPFDKVFTVYNKGEELPDFVCSGKCINCLVCYTDNDIQYISEHVR